MRNVFFVHNAFSFVVALLLIERLSLEKTMIVFAHKKASDIVSQVKRALNLKGVSLISYSGYIPPLLKLGLVGNFYISNPVHPRVFPFFFHWTFSRKVILIDDGFATINNNYRFDISPKSFILRVLAALLHRKSFSDIYTVFKFPSANYINSYSYGRLVYEEIPKELVYELSGRINNVEKYERMKDIVLVLGSVQKSAGECFRQLNLRFDECQVILKDHPNNKDQGDDLGMPVELFLIKYSSRIKALVHCGSSSAEFVKMFFNDDIELIKL
jgi:hypothetical protein